MPTRKPLQQVLKDQDGNLILDPTGNGQLINQANQGLTPSSPAAAAEGGANPHAAKMAGTPSQVSATPVISRQPIDPSTSLREIERAQQANKAQATPEQAAQAQEAQRLQQQFGDLGTRVQNLISGAAFVAAPQGGQPQLNLTDAAKVLTAEQQSALQAVVASQGTPESIAAAKKALGGQDPFKYINRSDVAGATGTALAGAAQNEMKLTPEVIGQLGYDANTLAQTLGVPPEQLGGMTLEQMQQTISDKIQAEFNQVQQMAARATDPALGPNERALARRALRDMGATGVFATEAEMGQLAQSVDSAEQVQFNGKVMSVAELLDDEFLSGLASTYVNSPENSDARKQLREKEPQLARWLDKNSKALQELSLHLDESEKQFNEIQGSYSKVVDSLSSTGLDPAAAKALVSKVFPGFEEGLMTSAADISQYPGLQLFLDPNKLSQSGLDPSSFTSNVSELANMSPDAAASLMKMTPDQIKQLGAGDRGNQKWRDYVDYVRSYNAAQRIDPSNPNAVAEFLFGDGVSMQTLEEIWQQELSFAKSGFASNWLKQAGPLLDGNGDGRIDNPTEIRPRLQSLLGEGVGISNPAAVLDGSKGWQLPLDQAGYGTDRALQFAGADGRITSDDVNKFFLNSFGFPRANINLKQILDSSGNQLEPEARLTLEELLRNQPNLDIGNVGQQSYVSKDFKGIGSTPGSIDLSGMNFGNLGVKNVK